MKSFLITLCAVSAVIQISLAYSSSWQDCEAFAALWSSSCGGLKADSAYDSEVDWHESGVGASLINCETRKTEDNKDIFAR